MEAVVIVTVLALVQYMFFGVQVGGARQRCGVSAPASSGNHEFECLNRIHQNTLEQLIVLLPVLWIFAHFVNPLWGAGLGVVYLIGRFIYRAAYMKDPKGRGLGFALSFLPGAIMAVWLLIVAVMSYI
jgi:glutathione S-transferase